MDLEHEQTEAQRTVRDEVGCGTPLMLTDPQIVERNVSSRELAVQEIVRLINRPHA